MMNVAINTLTNKLIAVFLLVAIGFQANAYNPDEGQIAPDFEIIQANGTSFKLSDYKGKKSVYVVFWNTWCHYCMKKTPKLLATEKYLSENIKIIAVNTSRQDSVEEMMTFKKRFNITYSLAFDHRETVTNLYNVHGVPTEFIIDINGIIKHRDGVPDKLEDSIGKWNETNITTTKSPTKI